MIYSQQYIKNIHVSKFGYKTVNDNYKLHLKNLLRMRHFDAVQMKKGKSGTTLFTVGNQNGIKTNLIKMYT